MGPFHRTAHGLRAAHGLPLKLRLPLGGVISVVHGAASFPVGLVVLLENIAEQIGDLGEFQKGNRHFQILLPLLF